MIITSVMQIPLTIEAMIDELSFFVHIQLYIIHKKPHDHTCLSPTCKAYGA